MATVPIKFLTIGMVKNHNPFLLAILKSLIFQPSIPDKSTYTEGDVLASVYVGMVIKVSTIFGIFNVKIGHRYNKLPLTYKK